MCMHTYIYGLCIYSSKPILSIEDLIRHFSIHFSKKLFHHHVFCCVNEEKNDYPPNIKYYNLILLLPSPPGIISPPPKKKNLLPLPLSNDGETQEPMLFMVKEVVT